MEGGRLAKDVWLNCKWKGLCYLQENSRIFPIFIYAFALHSMKTSLPVKAIPLSLKTDEHIWRVTVPILSDE